MFRVVIVDDEPKIVKSIEKYCKESPLVEITKVETNPLKLLDDLLDSSYEDFNLFLLDIEMPVQGDFIAQKIKEKYPKAQIVFVSGYEQRGAISFKNNELIAGVIDKPVQESKLLNLLSEINKSSLVLKLFNVHNPQQSPIERLVSTTDIIAITSDTSLIKADLPKNNIALCFVDGCYRLNSSITAFIKEYQIDEKNFIKISQSTYLNLNSIKEYSKAENTVTTNNELKFHVSRSCKYVFGEIKNRFSRK